MTEAEKAAQWDDEMLALLADVKASIDAYLHKRKSPLVAPLSDERECQILVGRQPDAFTGTLPGANSEAFKEIMQEEIPAA